MLPCLDDVMTMKHGFSACVRLTRRHEGDFVRARLRTNVLMCHVIPSQQRRQLGFDVDFAEGKFQVPSDRWETLEVSVDSILAARQGRVLACRLASVTGTVLSTHLSWGPVTEVCTRHLYALINSVVSLNCWVVFTEEAVGDLTFW